MENQVKSSTSCGHAPAIYRILGWLSRRAEKNPQCFWFRFDAAEFSEVSGVSIRQVRNVMNQLRANPEKFGFHWRTAFNRSRGARGSWEVLFGPAERLRWDREPLFRDRTGRSRHIRKGQREKTVMSAHEPLKTSRVSTKKGQCPSCGPQKPGGSAPFQADVRSGTKRRSECNPYREGLSESQQRHTPRASRDCGEVSPEGKKRLWRKAAAMSRRLSYHHWDSCRVQWKFTPARAFAYGAILAGHEEDEIRRCYQSALDECHGIAVDMGKYFNISSTIKRGRKRLARDGRSRDARLTEFYKTRAIVAEQVRKSFAEANAP